MEYVNVSTDFDFMCQKGLKPSVILYLDCYSFYDEKKQVRLIEKKNLTGAAMSAVVKDLNNNNATISIKFLRSMGLIEEYDDGHRRKKFYSIKDREGRHIHKLPMGLVQMLLRRYKSETILIYLYLCIQHTLFAKPYFCIADIMYDVFGYEWTSGQATKRLYDSLELLKKDDMISYLRNANGTMLLTSVRTEPFDIKG